MKISGPKDAPVKSSFLTISLRGPTHQQGVLPSLFGRLDHPIYPSLVVTQVD